MRKIRNTAVTVISICISLLLIITFYMYRRNIIGIAGEESKNDVGNISFNWITPAFAAVFLFYFLYKIIRKKS
jgi:hypothetical protein